MKEVQVWKYEPSGDEVSPGAILCVTQEIPKLHGVISLEDHARLLDSQARDVVSVLEHLPQGVLVRVAIYLMQDYCDRVAGHFHMSYKD